MTEIAKIFEGRASLYEYLSLVFRAPPESSFIGLSAEYAQVAAKYAEDGSIKAMIRGADILRGYADAEKNAEKPELLNDLNTIYTSLFSLGFVGVASTESGFLSPGGMVKQEQWEAVSALYKKWGYKNPTSFNEPEDHISMELRFMEKLSFACAGFISASDGEKLRGTIETQIAFLENHMMKWVPAFCGQVIQRSTSYGHKYKLYEAVALITATFIEKDIEFLKEIL